MGHSNRSRLERFTIENALTIFFFAGIASSWFNESPLVVADLGEGVAAFTVAILVGLLPRAL